MANDLDLPSIATAQTAGQHQTSNDADAALGNAFGDLFEVDFSGGAVTLTAAEFRSAFVFVADGLTASRALTLPAVKRPFAVYNPDATYSVNVTKGSTVIEVGPAQYGRFHTDGTTNGLVGVVSDEATGGGGGGVSATQTDFLSGIIATPADQDYRIALNLPYAITITKLTTRSASGTCTLTGKINTTALGGTANSVSSTEQAQAHASSNAASAGDDIVLTVSSNSTCVDLSFLVEFTRTLA